MEQFARFWMNSIHSYVGSDDGSEPPVILVGTHKDKLEGNEHARQMFKDEYFEKVRELFENTVLINHIQQTDYAVDSTDPEDIYIAELRKEVIRLGTKYQNAIKIPARWIPLERELEKIRKKKIITFDEVMEIDSKTEFPLFEEDKVRLFLLYHHSKGTLFFFDEEPISAYIVLDTQFLIDAFKCIVTSERFCKKDPSCRHLWQRLVKEARLEKELVEKLWKSDLNEDFLKHKSELLMFLQKHLIISEVSHYDEETSKSTGLGWYIVPSFLKDQSLEEELKMFLTGKEQTAIRFVMQFYNSPVVQVLHYRLLAALTGRWPLLEIASPKKKSLIYENIGVVRLDKFHAGIMERNEENIELRVVSLRQSGNIDHKVADTFRRFAESVVTNEFKKLRRTSDIHEKPFARFIRCNHREHGFAGSSVVIALTEVEDDVSLPCPDLMSHELFRDEVLSEWFQQDKVTEMTPDLQLTEKQLGNVANAVGNNWDLLGIELGLTEVEMQHISMDNPTCALKIYKMLIKWMKRGGENATINALVQAMKRAKKVHIQWDEIRNIIDKINFEQALRNNAAGI